ncbi:hypothetical protein D9M69_583910 [compost metagenome]
MVEPGIDPSQPVKSAFAWASNDFALSINGKATRTDTAGAIPALTTSTLYLGKDYGSSRYLNGHLRSLRYYPARLSNAELQALTS